MLLTSTTLNGAVSNDSNNNITMSVGNTVIANVNSSGIFFESGKKAIYTGAVLQVVSATKTDTFSMSSSDYVDVTGLSVSITPTSATNKVLIMVHLHLDSTVGGYTNPWRMMRNSTPIHVGDANSNARLATGEALLYTQWVRYKVYIKQPNILIHLQQHPQLLTKFN